MQSILLYTIVLGFAGLVGLAALTNEVVVNPQGLGLFNSVEELTDPACECEGEDGTFSMENCDFAILGPEAEMLCTWETPMEEYIGVPEDYDQGCSVAFWKTHNAGIKTYAQFVALGADASQIEGYLFHG